MAHYVGVDVAKATLEVGVGEAAGTRRFPNTQEGVRSLLDWLRGHGSWPDLQVVLEPTSTYHQRLVQALVEGGVPYSLINPGRTAAYARLLGRRAKTDRLDARLLASLGESQRPASSPPPDEAQERLRALRRHREWLEGEARAAANRLEAARSSPWTPPAVVASLERTMRELEREAQQIAGALKEEVRGDERTEAQVELLTSIPGVGERTAVLVLSELPPVARCAAAKAWVAFCGVNPEPRESGTQRSSRLSRAGSARVRKGLYLAAVSALRWNPAVHALGERLKGKGKRGRVRVMAAMNKLLRLCYGVLKSGRPFDPTMHLHALTP